jgi:hypothetical protein
MTPPGEGFVSPESFIPLDSLIRSESFVALDVLVTGRVCVGGCCRPIVQWVHGRVYAEGDSYIAWHQPANPLRCGNIASEDTATGKGMVQMWEQWAETTE